MRPTVKLGEISTIQAGGTPNRSKKEYYEGGNIPRLKSGELNDSFSINENEEFITELGMENSSAKLFKKGTLLMAMYGATAGKLGILNIDATTNQAVCSIQNTKGLFDNLYVFYYLFLIRNKIIIDSFGGAQPNISKDYIKNIEIPLPPLETQKAIVTKLDQIFAELDQTKSEIQKSLDNTDELWKSALNQAFQGDWEMKKLGEVCDNIFAGGDKPKNFSEEQTEKYKVPVYANGVDKDGLVGFTDVARVNNICLTVSGRGTIGFPVIRENPFVPIVRLIVAIPNKDLNIKYLWYSVLGIDFNDTGVAIPQLTVPRFKEHMITVPPLSEQEKIVEHLDQVSKEVKALKSQYQSQLDNLEELKKSVLDKAFRGELVE